MNISYKEYIPLKDYTYYRIGGKARYFACANDEQEIIKYINEAQAHEIPVYIIGEGSNLLVSDNGFPGLILKIENKFILFNGNKVSVGAGVNLWYFIKECLKRGLSGLEYLSGIPGSVGAAIYGNVGAFGHEIKDSVLKVTVYNIDEAMVKNYYNPLCNFSYRSSIFKQTKEIILSAEFVLKPGFYPEDLFRKAEQIIFYRQQRHPKEPNAGSYFQNITDKDFIHSFIEQDYTARMNYINKWHGKLPAGYLIEKLGLKGKKIGGAEVSYHHANFIINQDNALAEHIIMLAGLIKERVWNEFGIHLREEVQHLW